MDRSALSIENYNNDFLIIKSADRTLLAAAGKDLFERRLDFVDEVIVAEMEVCIKLNARFEESHLAIFNELDMEMSTAGRSYRLPIYFKDTEDWQAVEQHTGLTKEIVTSKILETDFSVAMFGFLPGFVYLDGLDPSLHVPRKTVPSKYVAANSLAIGGTYIGIYSIDSPGGWHVIGAVPLSVLNLEALPPLDFNIRDTIQLVAIDHKMFDQIIADDISFKTYNS